VFEDMMNCSVPFVSGRKVSEDIISCSVPFVSEYRVVVEVSCSVW